MTQYIIRFDDLSHGSDLSKWKDVLECCKSNGVRCLVGVIPKCKDRGLIRSGAVNDAKFWTFVKGAAIYADIAMHGFEHEIFGGVSYDGQFKLMAGAMKAFVSKNIIPDCFIAPKHIYDDNTLLVMKELGVGYISDGVGLYPWKHLDTDIIFVPQVLWRPRKILLGVVTFCLHPDTMSVDEIKELKGFISENKGNIISIYDVVLTPLEFINFIFEPLYTLFYKHRFGVKPTAI
jgi:hypothetical protein